MREKLLPLRLPPGLVNNGTTYQSKGRWFSGNLVRFYQGTIQPVGGWVQRTTTGATISGTPNAALSWQSNDGNTYLAIGTSTNLYIVTSANVVYDITPGSVGSETDLRWQLDTFGSFLVASWARDAYVDDTVINTAVWRGVLATAAAPAYTVFTGPGSTAGVVVTPERFFVVLRGADPLTWVPDTSDGTGGEEPAGEGPDGSSGSAPTETPEAPTLATTSRPDRITATWVNTNHTASVRIEWSTADAEAGPFTVRSTTELSPETTTSSFTSVSETWAIARLQYFNSEGAGPWGASSAALLVEGRELT